MHLVGQKQTQVSMLHEVFVQGGIADFTVFDEKEARLADFVIDVVPRS